MVKQTYQGALDNAAEIINMLVEIYQEKGKALPKPETLYRSIA